MNAVRNEGCALARNLLLPFSLGKLKVVGNPGGTLAHARSEPSWPAGGTAIPL